MSGEFTNMNIDDECCYEKDEGATAFNNNDPFQNQIEGRHIMQLKNNNIPKGLVSLEKLFDENDVARSPRITANNTSTED